MSPGAMSPIDPELWRNRKANPEAIESEFRSVKGREWLMRWLPSRAHDNGLFIVFSNGVGEDDGEAGLKKVDDDARQRHKTHDTYTILQK